MNELTRVAPDQEVRQQALDTSQSFIVQAPAGSGKTELLTQRILALLTISLQPEHILAITFTRKAAAEMRQRIITALNKANQFNTIHNSNAQQELALEKLGAHEKNAMQLALACLQRNEQQQWCLLENPNRLQIKTIDSFCSSLTFQFPVLSQLGSQANIAEDAKDLYSAASQKLLLSIEDNKHPWHETLKRVLLHLDNNYGRVERLFNNMLGRREQWIPVVMGAKLNLSENSHDLQDHIEKALQAIIEDCLQDMIENCDLSMLDPLIPLFQFFPQQLEDDSPLSLLADYKSLPSGELDQLEHWQAICETLLTKESQWRKTVTKKNGFPAQSSGKDKEEKALFKSQKESMLELLDSLIKDDALLSALQTIRGLPNAKLDADELNITTDLITLLPLLLAFLQIEFQENTTIDFSEISLRAINSLEEISDISLKLDYQIQHILIDEFQDTSTTQQHLLENLVKEWQNYQGFNEDGKTLFLVGDPMQSIYRFREANVGIFLKAQREGLRSVHLEPLKLSTNFRSQQGIVQWVNHIFSQSFPQNNSAKIGAVAYTASTSFDQTNDQSQNQAQTNVECSLTAFKPQDLESGTAVLNNRDNEALEICTRIESILSNEKTHEDSIAILLRTKSLAAPLIKQFKKQGLGFEAVEIDSLGERSHILDLVSLSSALLDHGDKISWFALLRSPLLGLPVEDLLKISLVEGASVWSIINDPAVLQQFSNDSQLILKRSLHILQNATADIEIKPLSLLVESAWLSLGGPQLINVEDFGDCKSYFSLLREIEHQLLPLNTATIEAGCEKLYSQNTFKPAHLDTKNTGSGSDTAPISIMSIHKSKGLEFDHVFIPGLEKGSRGDEQALLHWDIYTDNHGADFLLLSPMERMGYRQHSLYTYLQKLEKTKAQQELIRLLYVATTRAKKQLYLFANVVEDISEDEHGQQQFDHSCALKAPKSGSLLSLIWPYLGKETRVRPFQNQVLADAPKISDYHLHRLNPSWQHPFFKDAFKPRTQHDVGQDFSAELNIPKGIYEPASSSRIIGNIFHRFLKQLVLNGKNLNTESISAENFEVETYEKHWRLQLQQEGIFSDQELEDCLKSLNKLTKSVLEDKENAWIFANDLQDSRCEYSLVYHEGNSSDTPPRTLIVDRSFIKDNTRWVIDYKTAEPDTNETVEGFLTTQIDLYQNQLSFYALCFSRLEKLPQQKALYFPKISRLALFD